MIYLFTDFSFDGPYVGQMKSVIASLMPATVIIDLMHDAPKFNPRSSAYILAALSNYLDKKCIVVGVVDPGVGDPERRPIMIQADERWYVGPDNGLFEYIVANATSVLSYELIPGKNISNTFHGRDVFALAAALLANGEWPECRPIDCDSLKITISKSKFIEIIYIDHYGNGMTSIREKNITKCQRLKFNDTLVHYADTFSSVKKGELFWYVNSIGLIEISQNCGSAGQELNLFIGKRFEVV